MSRDGTTASLGAKRGSGVQRSLACMLMRIHGTRVKSAMLQEPDDQRRYSGVSREQGMIAINGRECLCALEPCLLNQQRAVCWTCIAINKFFRGRCKRASLDRHAEKGCSSNIPCVRARLAQPKKGYIFQRFPTPCTGVQPFVLNLAQAFSKPSILCFWGCLIFSVPNFRVQSRLTTIFGLAKNHSCC